MATSLEALGAAGAILQVISFASDVIIACKRIYDRKPTTDNDLERYAKQMSDASGRVQDHFRDLTHLQPGGNNQTLQEVVKDCRVAAQKLEAEVRSITSIHEKGNMLKAVYATMRASSHRKKIEKLELSIYRSKQLMETELTSHLCSRTDAIDL
ncbi:hypothetical protein F53441_5365 [Fusarium austroafricanum]|uniref:NACHT-NTPase and P-loop NTPases N-terminal domain-containing protein n=1 Tax=Fusarium austroafricanum TaxID=2364996 RepID=A0A8H4KK12_9HYPO|nr:hypothetical protein F53441_5365 [Fusarium austroafricanum]